MANTGTLFDFACAPMSATDNWPAVPKSSSFRAIRKGVVRAIVRRRQPLTVRGRGSIRLRIPAARNRVYLICGT